MIEDGRGLTEVGLDQGDAGYAGQDRAAVRDHAGVDIGVDRARSRDCRSGGLVSGR